MTRFNISLKEGVEMVLWTLDHGVGGEILVPKIASYRVIDLAEAIGPGCKKTVIGLRPGEKIHEEMITTSDSFSCVDLGKYFAILPSEGVDVSDYLRQGITCTNVTPGFSYNSGSNPEFLSVETLRALIRSEVDPEFQPI